MTPPRAKQRSAVHQPLVPPAGGVAVRMYRLGLGDCFLLAFAGGQRPVFVLIDCGVHRKQPHGSRRLQAAVADIVATTGGRLDVVVVTSAREEHVAGFLAAEQDLAKNRLAIDRLWLPGTLDPRDAQAPQRAAERRETWLALDAARRQLAAKSQAAPLGVAEQELHERIEEACLSLGEMGEGVIETAALALLRRHARKVSYLRPRERVLKIPGATSARAYVLGPAGSETAAMSKTTDAQSSLVAALRAASSDLPKRKAAATSDETDPSDDARQELSQPFSQACRISLAEAQADPYLRTFFGLDQSGGSFLGSDVGSEWLGAAERWAQDESRHAHEASLALALEIGAPRTGRVLLFPGDAQTGEWLAWSRLRWGSPKRPITVADLFARTAVYKVADHGSGMSTPRHDETERPFGWGQMPAGLVALLPVDEAVARALPGWNMPAPPLRAALLTKASQSLLRGDNADPQAATPPEKWQNVPGLAKARWRSSSARAAGSHEPLYYDIVLK